MSSTVTSLGSTWLDAVKGEHGTIGLFSAAQQAFIAFGLLGGGLSWLVGSFSLPTRSMPSQLAR